MEKIEQILCELGLCDIYIGYMLTGWAIPDVDVPLNKNKIMQGGAAIQFLLVKICLIGCAY